MKQSGIKIKYLVPALLVLVLCVSMLAVGNSLARTQTGVIWFGQLDIQRSQMAGEYLLSGGQRILMDELPVDQSRQIPIILESASGGDGGSLRCSVAYEDAYGVSLSPDRAYMTAGLSTDSAYVASGSPASVMLTLTPTDYAREVRGYEVVVITTVTWSTTGGVLSAQFITTLPVVEPAGDGTDGEGTVPGASTEASTAATETTAPTQTTAAATEATAPTQTTAAATEATAPTQSTAAATETAAPEAAAATGENAEQSADAPAAASDTQTENQTEAQADTQTDVGPLTDDTAQEGTETVPEETVHVPVPTEPVTVTAGQGFSVSNMTAFDPEGDLAVVITLPTGSTGAVLTMADGSEFPAMTRYRVGRSGQPVLLLDGGVITLTGREDGVYSLLLDFSATGLTWYEDVAVPSTQEGGETQAEPEAQTEPETQPETTRVYRNISLTVTSLTTGQTAIVTSTASLTAVQPPKTAPVLRPGDYTQVKAPEVWGDCTLTYTLSRLETDALGAVYYTPVYDPSSEGLRIARYTDPSISDTLSIATVSASPIPGTYRLTLTWSYQGLTIHQIQFPFFVNASGYALY